MNKKGTRNRLIKCGIPAERLPAKAVEAVDLSLAHLHWADLRRADLTGAVGPFEVFRGTRHVAIAAGGYISIGYERHSYEEWLMACGLRGMAYGLRATRESGGAISTTTSRSPNTASGSSASSRKGCEMKIVTAMYKVFDYDETTPGETAGNGGVQ